MRIKAHTHRGRGAWYLLARACKYTYICSRQVFKEREQEREKEGDCQSQAIQLAQRIAAAALYVRVCVCVCVYQRNALKPRYAFNNFSNFSSN